MYEDTVCCNPERYHDHMGDLLEKEKAKIVGKAENNKCDENSFEFKHNQVVGVLSYVIHQMLKTKVKPDVSEKLTLYVNETLPNARIAKEGMSTVKHVPKVVPWSDLEGEDHATNLGLYSYMVFEGFPTRRNPYSVNVKKEVEEYLKKMKSAGANAPDARSGDKDEDYVNESEQEEED